jgi:hypothetical protein
VTISPQIRLVALVGLIAAVALAGGLFLVSRDSAKSSPQAPLAAASAPIPKAARLPGSTSATAPPAPGKPARAKATRKSAAVARDTGLPIAVTRALRRHAVVVVALYARGSAVDQLARAESKAGARDARAGFVALNVEDRRQIEPLVRQTAVVQAPALLVFRRPDKLRFRLDGYADRVSVAQAVADARR